MESKFRRTWLRRIKFCKVKSIPKELDQVMSNRASGVSYLGNGIKFDPPKAWKIKRVRPALWQETHTCRPLKGLVTVSRFLLDSSFGISLGPSGLCTSWLAS